MKLEGQSESKIDKILNEYTRNKNERKKQKSKKETINAIDSNRKINSK